MGGVQIEVAPGLGEWKVVKHTFSGGHTSTDLGYFRLKRTARLFARGAAKATQAELVIKDRQGVIREKLSYGNDPRGRG